MDFKRNTKHFFYLLRALITGYLRLVVRFIRSIVGLPSGHPLKKGGRLVAGSVRIILIPFLIAFAIFYFVHPTFAQLSDRQTRLSDYLAKGKNLDVGVDAVDGYSHAYYIFEGDKIYLTTGSFNDKQVNTNGEYIVWSKEAGIDSHIFLFNVLSGSTVGLSYGGTNLLPKVSKTGRVVWESWVEDPNIPSKGNWQLFVYDGKVIKQITQGDLSTHPAIEGDFVVYARKDPRGLWRSEAYSIKEDKTADIDVGNDTEYPKLDKGDIYVGPPTKSQKRYPLKVGDLFIVNLVQFQQGSAGEVTLDTIQKELDLAGSIVASQSALTPTSSDSGALQTP